jgi:hypothetical protein
MKDERDELNEQLLQSTLIIDDDEEDEDDDSPMSGREVRSSSD